MREVRFYRVDDLTPGEREPFGHRVAHAIYVAWARHKEDPGCVLANDDVVTNSLGIVNSGGDHDSPRFVEALGEQPTDFGQFEAAFAERCGLSGLAFTWIAEGVWDFAKKEWLVCRFVNQ
jgi:hypothetical protein